MERREGGRFVSKYGLQISEREGGEGGRRELGLRFVGKGKEGVREGEERGNETKEGGRFRGGGGRETKY